MGSVGEGGEDGGSGYVGTGLGGKEGGRGLVTGLG